MDFPCISGSQLCCILRRAPPGGRIHSDGLLGQRGQSGREGAYVKSVGWSEGSMASRFSKVAFGHSLVVFLLHPPRFPLRAGLGGRFHTHLPPSIGPSRRVPVPGRRAFPSRQAGTQSSLRVWWKNEAALMELPSGSEHLLDSISVEPAHILLKHHKCKVFLLLCN